MEGMKIFGAFALMWFVLAPLSLALLVAGMVAAAWLVQAVNPLVLVFVGMVMLALAAGNGR